MGTIELHSRFWGSLWPVFLFIILPHGEVCSHYTPRLITAGSEGREGVQDLCLRQYLPRGITYFLCAHHCTFLFFCFPNLHIPNLITSLSLFTLLLSFILKDLPRPYNHGGRRGSLRHYAISSPPTHTTHFFLEIIYIRVTMYVNLALVYRFTTRLLLLCKWATSPRGRSLITHYLIAPLHSLHEKINLQSNREGDSSYSSTNRRCNASKAQRIPISPL